MKRRWTAMLAAVVGAVLLAGCGSASPASSPSSDGTGGGGQKEKVTLRLKWVHQAQFAGFYAAKELGYYYKAGLDVDIQPGGPDFPSVQMVASGSEQFGVTGADQILLSREKGVPVVAVAAIYRKTPFVLFSLKELGIRRMEDLKGKTVGVKLGGNEELTYRAMVKAAGVDPKSIKEVPVKYDLTPLLTGQVDVWPGYIINEVLAVKEQGKDVNIISPTDYGINLYADTLFTTEKMIREKPQVVKAFVQASMEGWRYAVEHPEEAAAFGLKYSNQLNKQHEEAMMKASIDLLVPQQLPLGKMETREWETLQRLLLDMGFMKEQQDISRVYTNEFLP